MGSKSILLFGLLYASSVLCQESGRTFQGLSIFSNPQTAPEVTYREITGLRNDQKGYTISSQGYNPNPNDQLTASQKKEIAAQENFRRRIAEANRRVVVTQRPVDFTPSQQVPAFDEMTFQGLPKVEPLRVPETFVQRQQPTEQRRPVHISQQPGLGFRQEPADPTDNFESSRLVQRPQPNFQDSRPVQRQQVNFDDSTQFAQEQSSVLPPFRSIEQVQQPAPVFRQQQQQQQQTVPFRELENEQVQGYRQNLQQTTDNFETESQVPQRAPEFFRPVRPQRLRQPVPPPKFEDDTEQEPSQITELTNDDIARKQNENAKYSFQTAVTDSVNDNSQIRQETRDGLKITGLYSYSDGFFRRTVHYVADENGYRIVKEESSPIGSGPQYNPDGQVDVSTSLSGSSLKYTIPGDKLPQNHPHHHPHHHHQIQHHQNQHHPNQHHQNQHHQLNTE